MLAGGIRAQHILVMLCLQRTLVRRGRDSLLRHIKSGAGGIRTLVQTVKPHAFYMLIPDFGFRAAPRPGPPSDALASKSFADDARQTADYSRYCCTAMISQPQEGGSGRCPVPSPCKGIKLIYCTSIRQREHTHCCQLNC